MMLVNRTAIDFVESDHSGIDHRGQDSTEIDHSDNDLTGTEDSAPPAGALDIKYRLHDITRPWFDLRTLLMVLLVILLSVADAFFTLFLISTGAEEINPFMDYFLNFGPYVFFAVKYLLTCSSIFIVLLIGNVVILRGRLRARGLLTVFAGLFSLVVLWELFLIMRHAGFG